MSDCTTFPTIATESPQRNPDGTFAKGNKGGPGNSFARETAEMRRVFAECCTQEDLIAIAHVLLEKARAGEMQAIKLVLNYRLGKPALMKECYEEEDSRAEAPAVEESAGAAELCGAARQGSALERGNGSSSPLPNGFFSEQRPLPNGFFSEQRPLPNGFSEAESPPSNPRTRAQMRAKRLKKEKRKRRKATRRARRCASRR